MFGVFDIYVEVFGILIWSLREIIDGLLIRMPPTLSVIAINE